MKKYFKDLFKKSLKKLKIKPGSVIKGKILSIKKNFVLIDTGLKSESNIPINQFYNSKNKLKIKIGDKIDVFLDYIENGFGETILSREKAKRYKSWIFLEKSYKKKKIVTGYITNKVKGGFTIELNEIKAFLPGSLVDIRPIHDTKEIENKKLKFKIIKLDKKRNNIVVSRKAVIELKNNIEREKLLKKMKEGIEIEGIVKNLTDYGAFIDLGGIDGLLHITDISWKRIKHPNEFLNISDKINVKVLKFDRKKIRVSLGLKQLSEDPWKNIDKKYPKNKCFKGKVTNLTDYGCFVQIKEGIEGLVHISEMNWTNKNIKPTKIVKIGKLVKVMILNIDHKRRRISLGLKQCLPNPWKRFSKKYNKGDKIKGKIKSITNFGIFINLKNGINGLIHKSDISWNNKKKIKKYKKGENISSIILQVDSFRERISLGIKQLKKDPINYYINKINKKNIISGRIKKINKKNIILKFKYNIKGYLNILELSKIFGKNIKKYISSLKINKILKIKLLNVDRKKRIIYVSYFNEKN